MVIEGLDGSGISTQTSILNKKLGKLGYKTLPTKEPTNGLIGKMIRSALSENWSTSFKSLQLLFCADRAKHLEDEIEPALLKGKVVICDRYLFSTLAYGFAAGVDWHWLFNVNREFRMPDLTILIDTSPDVSLSRIESGREKHEMFEKREVLGKVRKSYMNLAKRFRFKIVNGEQSKEDVGRQIEQIVVRFLTRR